MNEIEQLALNKMKEKRYDLMFGFFSHMKRIDRMSLDDLKCTGYSTKDAAIIGYARFVAGEIDKLLKAHIKQFPDT